MNECRTCRYFERGYSDDGYLDSGTCMFQFPPIIFNMKHPTVEIDDSCDLHKEPDDE